VRTLRSKREQFAGPRIMETCPQPGHMLPDFRPRRPPTLGPFLFRLKKNPPVSRAGSASSLAALIQRMKAID
jgi:hypothetical protein